MKVLPVGDFIGESDGCIQCLHIVRGHLLHGARSTVVEGFTPLHFTQSVRPGSGDSF